MSTKFTLTAAAALAVTGSAFAADMGQTFGSMAPNGMEARGITNSLITIDITGVESFDGLGSPFNTVLEVDLADALGLASGSQVTMTSIGWDVTLSTFGASWLSEATMYFDDNVAPDEMGLFLGVGAGENAAGSMAFASGGQLDLSDATIPNIVLPNGVLRIEFFEGFDDVLGEADAIFDGSITVGVTEVPTPGAAALLGLAGAVGLRRRR